jgi:2-methylisocitrate lyase-like PEP mutase family enzyme
MPAAALRKRLLAGGIIAAPGVHDPYSARIVESLGFGAVYLGGNALGLHLGIGQPFVTLTETVDAVQKIRRVVGAPVIADAGAGFGDAAHAALAMRTFVAARAAAVHIDDQIYPKRAHYHRGKGRLAGIEAVSGKLRAMAAARSPDETLLIARTDAWRVTGSLEDTLGRCRAYLEAGADALMVLDLAPADAGAFRANFSGTPLIWIGGIAEPIPTLHELSAAGFAMALYPFNTIAAVTEAVLSTWRAFAVSGRPPALARPYPAIAAEALGIVGIEHSLEIERNTTERAGLARTESST